MDQTQSSRPADFRALHERGWFILPNAWDIGSAVRLARLGFRAIASTSSGAAWALDKEDGELTLDEVLAHLAMLVGATPLPVNADFENGFADAPDAVAANAARAVATGIAALSIEDWSGERRYDPGYAADRIAAARAAIDAVDSAVMLVGRAEQFRSPELPASDGVARAVAYAAAGADCLFVPMLTDPGAVAELVAAVAPKPVNILVHRYDETIPTLAALGVRRFSVGGSLARAAWDGFDRAAASLKSFDAR